MESTRNLKRIENLGDIGIDAKIILRWNIGSSGINEVLEAALTSCMTYFLISSCPMGTGSKAARA
jgi:hypothetical protein